MYFVLFCRSSTSRAAICQGFGGISSPPFPSCSGRESANDDEVVVVPVAVLVVESEEEDAEIV